MSINQYTNEELSEIYKCYCVAGRDSEFAQQLYQDQFPELQLPRPQIFEEVDRNLRSIGSFFPQQNVNATRNNQRRREFPQWQASNSLLLLDPTSDVCGKRREFCNWFKDFGAGISDDILFTDERPFKGNGYNHKFSLNVWCGVMGRSLIGPIFLPLNLKGEEYLNFLSNQLPLILRDFGALRRQRMWFMHDGAPPHRYMKVQQLLNTHFPNRWIGDGGPILWPPYSMDLNPIDFYVWDKIKETIDNNRIIRTCDEYENQIVEAFHTFRNNPNHFEMISIYMDSIITMCIKEEGRVIKEPLRNFFRRN